MGIVETEECRFFVSYSGVNLPLRLVGVIDSAALSHRNSFIRASFDPAGVLKGFDKVVYGVVELSHRYDYRENGVIEKAEISGLDEEPVLLCFDEAGVRMACI
jgi:hypothetical protein